MNKTDEPLSAKAAGERFAQLFDGMSPEQVVTRLVNMLLDAEKRVDEAETALRATKAEALPGDLDNLVMRLRYAAGYGHNSVLREAADTIEALNAKLAETRCPIGFDADRPLLVACQALRTARDAALSPDEAITEEEIERRFRAVKVPDETLERGKRPAPAAPPIDPVTVAEVLEVVEPFAEHADTWIVQTAALDGDMLTLTNRERMSGIPATAFCRARALRDKLTKG